MRAVLLFTLLLFASSALAQVPVIIDGDTFALGSERVRIENIDAPETQGSR